VFEKLQTVSVLKDMGYAATVTVNCYSFYFASAFVVMSLNHVAALAGGLA